MHKRYRVKLVPEERAYLAHLLAGGKAAARTLTHARILLKVDEGVDGPGWTDDAIAAALEVNRSTIERVRQRCVEAGVEAALRPRPSRQLHPRKLDSTRRPTWSPWPVRRRRTGATAGRCACWPTSWWNWRWWRPSRTRRCARRSKKLAQAVAEAAVVFAE